MLLSFVSALFDFNQYTGFEHVRATTLLTVLGLLSIAVWIIIVLSMVVRHLATIALRLTPHTHSTNVSKLAGKK